MVNEFSFRTRKRDLENIENEIFDVAVIGGGITGAGITNLLAQNGLKVIMLEKSDFGSSTSQGSSKLLHGGLRYLQNGQFALVRELLKERNYLLKHMEIARMLEFRILIGKGQWKKGTIRLGLNLYSMLGGKSGIPRFHKNNKEFPPGIDGFFSYRDGWCDDSRLVMYHVVSAHENGAICLNYCEFKSSSNNDNVHELEFMDIVGDSLKKVKARIVVNCAGPWANTVSMALGNENNHEFKMSRGVHIVLSRDKYPGKAAVVFRSSLDERQMFIIPHDEVVIVGTTDTFTENSSDFTVDEQSVRYILQSSKPVLGDLSTEDVKSSFAGIRVLMGEGNDPGKISRDFSITENDGIIHVFGGKLTNHRVAARKVAKIVSGKLSIRLQIKGKPEITYKRGNQDNPYEYDMMHECAMFPEDIMRRREGYSIYLPDGGKSREEEIKKTFRRMMDD